VYFERRQAELLNEVDKTTLKRAERLFAQIEAARLILMSAHRESRESLHTARDDLFGFVPTEMPDPDKDLGADTSRAYVSPEIPSPSMIEAHVSLWTRLASANQSCADASFAMAKQPSEKGWTRALVARPLR
jgi:hypothetical protein